LSDPDNYESAAEAAEASPSLAKGRTPRVIPKHYLAGSKENMMTSAQRAARDRQAILDAAEALENKAAEANKARTRQARNAP
jgi:hypothetical protein